jgi:hypothetical protein
MCLQIIRLQNLEQSEILLLSKRIKIVSRLEEEHQIDLENRSFTSQAHGI